MEHTRTRSSEVVFALPRTQTVPRRMPLPRRLSAEKIGGRAREEGSPSRSSPVARASRSSRETPEEKAVALEIPRGRGVSWGQNYYKKKIEPKLGFAEGEGGGGVKAKKDKTNV